MGDKPADGEEPTLEIPKLFGRRKTKQKPDPAPVEDPPPVDEVQDEPESEPGPEPVPGRPARTRSRPHVPGTLAAALTGLLVGAVGCGLIYAALAGCEAVRGTDSCGGPGLFLLIAILALMVLFGAGLLALMGAASAGSTSFLAVGLVAVLVMVAFLDVVFSPWMFLVVPLMGGASYVLSHWVTTRFADEAADPAVFEDEPGPDIR